MANQQYVPVDHNPFPEDGHGLDGLNRAMISHSMLTNRMTDSHQQVAAALRELTTAQRATLQAVERLCRIMSAPRHVLRNERGKIIGSKMGKNGDDR
jgi:ribonucleotide monophosphatase NagD (HAD superfamily)